MGKIHDLNNVKKILAENKNGLRERFNVKSISIFGSYARGEQTGKSDLDVLVELSEPIGLFRLMDLEDYISKLVGLKVDVVTKGSLKPFIKDHILREAVYV